jgi:3-phosphoshikimate 1-carboxyvinyltransferase
MPSVVLRHPTRKLEGEIQLPLSKSESNRLLMIGALAKHPLNTLLISDAGDTTTMATLLQKASQPHPDEELFDVGPAGTTMRFLTAYFSILPGVRILTGTPRMKERPIGILVDALRSLGAKIDYLETEGCPPIRIAGKQLAGGEVEIDSSVSSQFISALMLIAPTLHNGLVIRFKGDLLSFPYINMTMRLMERCGATPLWHNDAISISNHTYVNAANVKVEADWSAASYWFTMAALAQEADLLLMGLRQRSFQGDSILVDLYRFFGVEAAFEERGLRLRKKKINMLNLAFDFNDCPDIVQAVAVTAGILRMPMVLNGLDTLRVKETDRVKALQYELAKLGVETAAGDTWLELKKFNADMRIPSFNTYEDHRMAMAFAPLALHLPEIAINDPHVVGKSYPGYWEDLARVGFLIQKS